jgi:anaerobic selenocysteine-containing dehydrogenase
MSNAKVDVLLALAQELGEGLDQVPPWQNEAEFLRDATSVWREGKTEDQFWGEWRRRGGWLSEASDPVAPVLSLELGAPPEVPAMEGAGDYPFHLHIYPSLATFDGRGANKPWLRELPDPMTTVAWQTWIEVNPHTAAELGLHDGDVVRVESAACGGAGLHLCRYWRGRGGHACGTGPPGLWSLRQRTGE